MTGEEIAYVCRVTNVVMPRASASKIWMAREHIGRRTWSGGAEVGNLARMLLPMSLLGVELGEDEMEQGHETLMRDVKVVENEERAVVCMQTVRGEIQICLRFKWKDGLVGRIRDSRVSYMPMRLRDMEEVRVVDGVEWTQ